MLQRADNVRLLWINPEKEAADKGDFPTVMAYSGAPEGHGFNETGMRHFLEVEIDAENVRITPVASSRSVYLTASIDCSPFTSSQDVVNASRALPREEGPGTVARITLVGTGAPEWRPELDAIYDAVAPDDFESMLDLDRYNNRSSAFDKIISSTHDHFWDPLDTKYIDFSEPFDLENEAMLPEEMQPLLRLPYIDQTLKDPKERIRFINYMQLWNFSSILHGEQGIGDEIMYASCIPDVIAISSMVAVAVSYTHLRAHETVLDLVCRLLLEKKKTLRKTQ